MHSIQQTFFGDCYSVTELRRTEQNTQTQTDRLCGSYKHLTTKVTDTIND